MSEVRGFLAAAGLAQYAAQVVDQEGYDDLATLAALRESEIAADLGFMKRGHQKRLYLRLQAWLDSNGSDDDDDGSSSESSTQESSSSSVSSSAASSASSVSSVSSASKRRSLLQQYLDGNSDDGSSSESYSSGSSSSFGSSSSSSASAAGAPAGLRPPPPTFSTTARAGAPPGRKKKDTSSASSSSDSSGSSSVVMMGDDVVMKGQAEGKTAEAADWLNARRSAQRVALTQAWAGSGPRASRSDSDSSTSSGDNAPVKRNVRRHQSNTAAAAADVALASSMVLGDAAYFTDSESDSSNSSASDSSNSDDEHTLTADNKAASSSVDSSHSGSNSSLTAAGNVPILSKIRGLAPVFLAGAVSVALLSAIGGVAFQTVNSNELARSDNKGEEAPCDAEDSAVFLLTAVGVVAFIGLALTVCLVWLLNSRSSESRTMLPMGFVLLCTFLALTSLVLALSAWVAERSGAEECESTVLFEGSVAVIFVAFSFAFLQVLAAVSEPSSRAITLFAVLGLCGVQLGFSLAIMEAGTSVSRGDTGSGYGGAVFLCIFMLLLANLSACGLGACALLLVRKRDDGGMTLGQAVGGGAAVLFLVVSMWVAGIGYPVAVGKGVIFDEWQPLRKTIPEIFEALKLDGRDEDSHFVFKVEESELANARDWSVQTSWGDYRASSDSYSECTKREKCGNDTCCVQYTTFYDGYAAGVAPLLPPPPAKDSLLWLWCTGDSNRDRSSISAEAGAISSCLEELGRNLRDYPLLLRYDVSGAESAWGPVSVEGILLPVDERSTYREHLEDARESIPDLRGGPSAKAANVTLAKDTDLVRLIDEGELADILREQAIADLENARPDADVYYRLGFWSPIAAGVFLFYWGLCVSFQHLAHTVDPN